MKRSHTTCILILILPLLLGALPAAAASHPLVLHGAGNLEFTGPPPPAPPTGANLTATGTATLLGQWDAEGEISFGTQHGSLIPASGTQTFKADNGDELEAEFTNAVLNTNTGIPGMGIAVGIFRFVGGTAVRATKPPDIPL